MYSPSHPRPHALTLTLMYLALTDSHSRHPSRPHALIPPPQYLHALTLALMYPPSLPHPVSSLSYTCPHTLIFTPSPSRPRDLPLIHSFSCPRPRALPHTSMSSHSPSLPLPPFHTLVLMNSPSIPLPCVPLIMHSSSCTYPHTRPHALTPRPHSLPPSHASIPSPSCCSPK